jgi:hypothetical protein
LVWFHSLIFAQIPADIAPGIYRIEHYGDWLDLLREVTPFGGSSASFEIIAA